MEIDNADQNKIAMYLYNNILNELKIKIWCSVIWINKRKLVDTNSINFI